MAYRIFLESPAINSFVQGLLQTDTFNEPYFMLFYQVVLSAAANAERIGWNPDCDFIFDEQGKLGEIAKSKWDWVKRNVDEIGVTDLSRHVGSPPIFRNDITFRPLQAADMFAWLVRDCITQGPHNMDEITRTALKHLERSGKTICLHIDKAMLMKLGAAFMVGRARLDGHL